MKRLTFLVCLFAAGFALALPPSAFMSQWRAASGAWTPNSIANCARWYDGADTETITKDGSGYVSAWEDKSQNADTAVQTGAVSIKPKSGTSTQNGLNTLSFDGGDYLNTLYMSLDGQTGFLVGKVLDSPAIALGARDSQETRSYFGRDNGGEGWMGVGAGTTLTAGNWGTAYHLLTGYYDGSNVNIRFDITMTASETQVGTGANTARGYMIGALNSLGSALAPITGNVAEIIIYTRVLTLTEIATVETYLKNKWGTP